MPRPVDEFTADAAAYEVSVELESKVLVLAEHFDGDGRSLEVQRAIDPESDEERLHCVVVDAGTVEFGAIESWSLDGAVLELTLTADAARTLGTERLRVQLADAALADPVRTAMRHLVNDGPEAPEFNSTR